MKLSDNKAQDQEAKIVLIEFIIIVALFFLAAHIGWLESKAL